MTLYSRVERNKCEDAMQWALVMGPAPSLARHFSNSRLEYRGKEFKNISRLGLKENNELVNTNDTVSLPVICK